MTLRIGMVGTKIGPETVAALTKLFAHQLCEAINKGRPASDPMKLQLHEEGWTLYDGSQDDVCDHLVINGTSPIAEEGAYVEFDVEVSRFSHFKAEDIAPLAEKAIVEVNVTSIGLEANVAKLIEVPEIIEEAG